MGKIVGIKMICFFLLGLPARLQAQGGYYETIRPIFEKKCKVCHQKNKHYFLFDRYESVKAKKEMIRYVITQEIMPPWPANDDYQTYKHSRALSGQEKKSILDWLDAGLPEGNYTKPVAKIKSSRKPGNEIRIKLPTMFLQPNERDTFITFIIPFKRARGGQINGIEFRSKSLSIIHHCNLFVGDSDIGIKDADFVFGYAPGMDQFEFSDQQGFDFPAQGTLSGDIHIPPLSEALKLDFTVVFKEAREPVKNKLKFIGMQGLYLDEMPELYIPRDTLLQVHGNMVIENDVYLTHIMPHMHLLGQSIVVWSEDTLGNPTHLIQIKDWWFRWQNFYEFSQPIFIPGGSKIFVQAVYNNTASNPNNPFSPPRDISSGWLSTQEMLSVFMLGYEPVKE
jgi:hypothetical protein